MALTDIDGQRLGDSVADKLGDRNLIINGAATVYQRGENTSISSGTTNFATDRWALQIDQAGTWTFSQSTDAPSGFGFSHKLDCTTSRASLAANSELIFQQRLEGQDLQNLDKGTADAKELTLSFYVKSAKTGTYIVEFQDANNGRNCQRVYTINTANTWEYKTLTVPGDTTGTLTNNNGHSFTIRYWLAAGSNFTSGSLQTDWGATVNADRAVGQVNLADSTSNDWFITGVQLEVGNTATPFQHESYAKTLSKCMRYYQEYTSSTNGFGISGAGYCETSTQTEFVFFLTVPMRTLASANITEIGDLEVKVGSSNFDVTGLDGVAFNDNFSLATVRTTNSNSGASAGTVARLRANNVGAGFQFNAEL
jgi:hypothetical protein